MNPKTRSEKAYLVFTIIFIIVAFIVIAMLSSCATPDSMVIDSVTVEKSDVSSYIAFNYADDNLFFSIVDLKCAFKEDLPDAYILHLQYNESPPVTVYYTTRSERDATFDLIVERLNAQPIH